MQIKFSHMVNDPIREVWEVFGDIDHYSFYEEIVVGDISEDGENDVLDFTETGNPNKRWVIEFFTKNTHGEASVLVAHSPIFILNEDGRTVDKI